MEEPAECESQSGVFRGFAFKSKDGSCDERKFEGSGLALLDADLNLRMHTPSFLTFSTANGKATASEASAVLSPLCSLSLNKRILEDVRSRAAFTG